MSTEFFVLFFFGNKSIFCEAFEFFSLSQNRTRPFRMVYAIRKMLSFEAKCASEAIIRAAFSLLLGKSICGIKLNSGLVGIRNKSYSGFISGRDCKRMTAYNKVCVISAKRFYAGFVVICVFSDDFRITEIHCCSLNGSKFTGRGAAFVANSVSVCDENCTPTGELASVEGTAMDFRDPKTIGKDAYNDEPCVKPFGGYDANFVISGHPFAKAIGDKTGITIVADTDQPGVQLYTANALTEQKGKGGADYGFRSAFCLETQHFPDCVNHPEWPSPILRKGEKFHSVTTYTFLCDRTEKQI